MLAKARREQFGQSSERCKLLVEQLELAIEDLEETQATDEDNERLKKMAADGATAARVAANLNRKIINVRSQARKFGIGFPTLREQRKKFGGSRVSTPF